MGAIDDENTKWPDDHLKDDGRHSIDGRTTAEAPNSERLAVRSRS